MAVIGLVVFANDSGLGAQTRRLAQLIRPNRLLAIDSSKFSKNKAQHFEWYREFSGYKVDGFPSNREIRIFLNGLTHVLVCENPLNFHLLTLAKQLRIKVYIQSNFEFCDHLDKNLELPEKFLMPSFWKIEEMKSRFGDNKVEYLPPPIDPGEFKDARQRNFERKNNAISKPRLLHIVGTLAANDRNGTLDLINALHFTDSHFELIIRSQHQLPPEYMVDDPRVKYVIENVLQIEDMYKDFDALILPRRYGGLSLTTNEALMSGIPVLMPNISPNNQLLQKEWLFNAKKKSEFYTRTMIDVYESDPIKIAEKIDWLCVQNLDTIKIDAFEIGYNEFSNSNLKQKYESLLNG